MSMLENHGPGDLPHAAAGQRDGHAEGPSAPATAPGAAPVEPVAAAERLMHVDVLRGFALFGILQVNMTLYGQPLYIFFTDYTPGRTTADAIAEFVIAWLFEGKFYALFSFLFGFGFALQMRRAQRRGDRFAWRYTRRLLVLLVLGAAHVLLLWYGDILLLYAVLGFLLLAVRNASARRLRIVGLSLYIAPFLVTWVLVGFVFLVDSAPTGAAQQPLDGQNGEVEAHWFDWAEYSIGIYRAGTWPQIFVHRLQNYRDSLAGILFITPVVLAMFVLGLYVARLGILDEPARHRALFRKLLVYGLPLGLLGNAIYAATRFYGTRSQADWSLAAGYTMYGLTMPLLTFGYVAAMLLLLWTGPGRVVLAPLAATGRMALSNYILQSVVCTTIFYGYGLGWFGELSFARGLVLAVAIYAAQLPLSMLWLSAFRFGPLEWLWRSLTYLRWQPMLR